MSTPATGWSLRTDTRFFEQASRRGTKFFTIYYLPHSSFEVAIIVPKTGVKLATDRNKLKRQLKAIVAKFQTKASVHHFKLAIATRQPAARATFTELEADLTQFLAKL